MDSKTTNGHILTIDDESEILTVIKSTAEECGFTADTVSNAVEGLEKARTGNYDVIFCDINMPEMTGLHLFAQIKARSVITPVVFVTGCTDRKYVTEALRLGATDFIDKPIARAVLKEVMVRAVEIGVRRASLIQTEQELLKQLPDGTAKVDRLNSSRKMLRLLELFNNEKRRAG